MSYRVCFFRLGATPLLLPGSSETFGGAEVRALTFARAMARRQHFQVSFAVRERDGLPLRTPDGIEVIPLPRRARGFQKLVGSVRRRLVSQPQPYGSFARIAADVVACFGLHNPTAQVIAAARHANVRSMVFLTSSEDVCPRSGTESAKERRARRTYDFALQHADAVIVQTEFQSRHLAQSFGRQGVLIRNPIDLQRTYSDQPRTHVLWVGRADCHSKRADICFSLARKCPDISFRVVMNDCGNETGNQLLERLPTNVTLEHHVPLEEIESRFAEATLLINTSVSEGFPNAFLQAAKYATPIVSLTVDPDGMLARHGCGIVAENEVRMAELINRLHFESATRASYGDAARRFVEERHELEQCVSDLESVLRQLTLSRRVA